MVMKERIELPYPLPITSTNTANPSQALSTYRSRVSMENRTPEWHQFS